MFKVLFVLWLIFFGIPAISFAKYLNNEKNPMGAGLVAILVIIAAYGVFQA